MCNCKLSYSERNTLKQLIWEKQREQTRMEFDSMERQNRLGLITDEQFRNYVLSEKPLMHVPYPWI